MCSVAAMLVGFAGPPRRSVSLSILSSRTPSTSMQPKNKDFLADLEAVSGYRQLFFRVADQSRPGVGTVLLLQLEPTYNHNSEMSSRTPEPLLGLDVV